MSIEIGLCEPGQRTAINPDWFFAQSGTPEAHAAMSLCMACPLYNACGDYALRHGVEYGIWGGTGARDRERAWGKAGRPTLFDEHFASQIRPLLQERRDYETWDDKHPIDDVA